MRKPLPSFSVRMRRWFTAHPWLKLVSLVLAVLVWLYVRGEIMGVP